MKYLPILLLLFFSCNLTAQEPKLAYVKGFGKNPGWLKMFVYKPKDVKPNAPLLVALHGCLQTAESYAKQSGWFKLADEHGFVILFPQTQTFNNISMCFNWFTPRDINKKKHGEPASIHNMINYLCENQTVDSNQIYITGVSAGGAMSVVMMALYPKTFRAGAPLAGGPYKAANNVFGAAFAMLGWVCRKPHKWAKRVRKQNPNYKGPYPRIVILHGRRDFVNNRGNARELTEQWAAINDISEKPSQSEKKFNGNKRVKKFFYKNEAGEALIIRYVIKGLGHRVPIDQGKDKNKGGKQSLFSKDINFHSTYWLAKDMGLVQ